MKILSKLKKLLEPNRKLGSTSGVGSGGEIIAGVTIAILAVVALIIALKEPDVCVEEAIVLDIVSVDYRSATVFTTKGTFTRNQHTFKDGDTICITYGRRNK